MAKRDFSFVQKVMGKPGALHKALHIPQDKKIPVARLQAAAKGSGVTAKRAKLALTMRTWKHR